MSPPWSHLIRATLAGERGAARELLQELYPLVRSRVARVLWRARGGSTRSVQQEVADMTQDVFRGLFDGGGRSLRGWDPARGLSFPNFVGLLAERHVIGILRSDRRNPWTEDPVLDAVFDRTDPAAVDAEAILSSRQLLEVLLERLKVSLSPLGYEMFRRLYVEEQAVPEVALVMNLSADAVYMWRSRLRKAVLALSRDLAKPPSGDGDPVARVERHEGPS